MEILMGMAAAVGFLVIAGAVVWGFIKAIEWMTTQEINGMKIVRLDSAYSRHEDVLDELSQRMKMLNDVQGLNREHHSKTVDSLVDAFRNVRRDIDELKMHDSMVTPEISKIYQRIHELLDMQDLIRKEISLMKAKQYSVPTSGKPEQEEVPLASA